MIRFEDVAAPGATISDGCGQIRLDKLLARTGLVHSITDGLRKIRENAVRVDGDLKSDLVISAHFGVELTLSVGRKTVRATIIG